LNRDPRQGITGSNLSDEGGPLDLNGNRSLNHGRGFGGKKKPRDLSDGNGNVPEENFSHRFMHAELQG